MTQQVMDIEEIIKTDHLFHLKKVIRLDNFFNVYRLLRHRLGQTTHYSVSSYYGVQWEASSPIISKPLITQKDINELRKAQTKNSRKLDKHAQTSSSGFAKEYTRFQFILQCFPGLEWDHEGKTCWINIPPETPTAWLVLSGSTSFSLCTQVQAQWHNLSLKSFGFSPELPQRHLHMRQYHSITITFYHMMYRLGSNFQVHELLNRHKITQS